MSRFDDMLEAIEELSSRFEKGKFPLDALPMNALQEKLEDTWNVEGDKLVLPHSVGPNELAEVPYCWIYTNAAQAIGHATHTKIAYDTVRIDRSQMADLANDRILIRVPGLYHVQFMSGMSGINNAMMKLAITRNQTAAFGLGDAVTFASMEMALPTGVAVPIWTVSGLRHFEAGDYIEGWIYQINAVPGTYNTFVNATDERNQFLRAAWIGHA